MTFMEAVDRTPIHYRTCTYRTSTVWAGGKTATLSSEGKPSICVSSPPEFMGVSGAWTPEDMFVASVELCHMVTFMSYARARMIPVVSYRSHANGVLEYLDDDFRFTRIVIFPTIEVEGSVAETEVHAILRETQKHCLVANSIASIVEVNPVIMML